MPTASDEEPDTFVARDDEQLFEESSDEDEDEAPPSNDDQDDDPHQAPDAPTGEPMQDASDQESEAPVNPMRARLEALARERKQRNEEPRPKKRHGDKAARREAKKAKVDSTE